MGWEARRSAGPLPPLLAGEGDMLLVLGFSGSERQAMLGALLRYGIVVGDDGSQRQLYSPFIRVCIILTS